MLTSKCLYSFIVNARADSPGLDYRCRRTRRRHRRRRRKRSALRFSESCLDARRLLHDLFFTFALPLTPCSYVVVSLLRSRAVLALYPHRCIVVFLLLDMFSSVLIIPLAAGHLSIPRVLLRFPQLILRYTDLSMICCTCFTTCLQRWCTLLLPRCRTSLELPCLSGVL